MSLWVYALVIRLLKRLMIMGKMMKKHLLLLMIFILILGVSNIYAADKEIIYGKKHAFKVELLENWAEDKAVMAKTGIPFFIRPMDEKDRLSGFHCICGVL